MSNSEPSAIVLQGIPCIGGLYISFNSNGENGSLNGDASQFYDFAQIHNRPYLNRSKSILKAWKL